MTVKPMPSSSRTENAAISATIQQEIARAIALPGVRAALAWCRAHEDQFGDWQAEMAAIPAPPFGEASRALWVKARFSDLGMKNVRSDEVGNVFGELGSPGKSY